MGWIVQKKRPSFVNLTGCILLIEGVFAFNVISYGTQSISIFAIFQPGFIWANLAAITFAIYSYIHEVLLHDIPSEFALGLIGISNSLWGWIPSLISHGIGYEVITYPGSMTIAFLILNGVTEIFAEYAAIYALRKTSSFIFNGTLTLASPLALLMMFLQNYFILHKSTRWSWMYIPTLFNIIMGCIYVYWNNTSKNQLTYKHINDDELMHLFTDTAKSMSSFDDELADCDYQVIRENEPETSLSHASLCRDL